MATSPLQQWVTNVRRELTDGIRVPMSRSIKISPAEVGEIITVMLRHLPFAVDVAYMPVPRCDGCRHWREFKNATGMGLCDKVDQLSTPVPGDFGCVQWEAK